VKWYSPSKLKATCLRKIRKESQTQEKEESPAMELGDFRHQVLARWYRDGTGPLAPIFKACKDAKVRGAEHADQSTLDQLEAYAAEHPQMSTDLILSIEGLPPFPDPYHALIYKKPMFQVPVTDDWGVRGICDLCYFEPPNTIVIVDHKGRSEEDISVQGLVYLYAARVMWGWEGCTVRFEARGCPPFWRDILIGKESGSCGSKEILFDWIPEALATIVQKHQEAEASDNWPAVPGDDCKFCKHKSGCPGLADEKIIEAPKSWLPAKLEDVDAEELVRLADKTKTYIKALQAVNDMINPVLVEKVEATNGVVEVDGKVRKLSKKNKYRDDEVGLTQLATKLGIELDKFERSGTDYSKLMAEIKRTITGLEKKDREAWDKELKACRQVIDTSKWLSSPRGMHSKAAKALIE